MPDPALRHSWVKCPFLSGQVRPLWAQHAGEPPWEVSAARAPPGTPNSELPPPPRRTPCDEDEVLVAAPRRNGGRFRGRAAPSQGPSRAPKHKRVTRTPLAWGANAPRGPGHPVVT